MAQWRSGSSVLGQLLSYNPELFYIFESLWPAATIRELRNISSGTIASKEIARDILRGFAKCEFAADFVDIYWRWPGSNLKKTPCSNKTSFIMSSAEDLGICCNFFNGRLATKIIHADLELLKPLVTDDGINVKIIHLVRDPRGTAASRINYLKFSYVEIMKMLHRIPPKSDRLKPLGLLDNVPKEMLQFQEIKENNPTMRGLCKWIRENTYLSPESLPGWLQGRYHLVKYEDFAMAPLKESQRIYDFIGMPFTAQMKQYINTITHPNSSDPPGSQSLFSISKNSQEIANKWKKYLTSEERRQITKECLDVLQLLLYQ
ncbi:carbohydrate sulfotransferase 5-like [Lytechinus variegatus]|uniref:carbohydrate sulfotransferase 5-like n=1 Tax=Lytechinus variegatus TaxID=7654 RepID=UPI001BB14C0D|nr:carbohydrate sulfotransferase 5-like [Lytechinus variegatus]